MDPLAFDAGTIPDRDCLVFFECQLAVVPLVKDDVPGPLAILGVVALVVPKQAAVEVGFLEVLRAFHRKTNVPFSGEGIALLADELVNSAQLRSWDRV
jgi:hypothetical protein